MKNALLTAIQLTWGLPQSLLGFAIFIIRQIKGEDSRFINGAAVTFWNRRDGLSLGMFLFVPAKGHKDRDDRMLCHEYGHYIQSLILGPLYLLLVGLPSFTWANLGWFQKLRREKGVSYYSVYPEKWANKLGFSALLK